MKDNLNKSVSFEAYIPDGIEAKKISRSSGWMCTFEFIPYHALSDEELSEILKVIHHNKLRIIIDSLE